MSKTNPCDLERVTWDYAIAEARHGRPGLLAAVVTSGKSVIPPDLSEDVRNVLANPVHHRRTGGRPLTLPKCHVRQIRRIFDALTSEACADAAAPAMPAWPRPKAVNRIARDLNISASTVRDILNHKKSYDYS